MTGPASRRAGTVTPAKTGITPGEAGGTGPARALYSHATQLHNNAYSCQARDHSKIQDPRKGHRFERGANRSPDSAHHPPNRALAHPPEGLPLPPRAAADG